MTSTDVIIQQMPHLVSIPLLCLLFSFWGNGISTRGHAKQEKAGVLGEGQVSPSLFVPAPLPRARRWTDGARVWVRPHLPPTGEEHRFWKEAGRSLDPGSYSSLIIITGIKSARWVDTEINNSHAPPFSDYKIWQERKGSNSQCKTSSDT